MNAELISGTAAFDILATEWDVLASNGMTNTPFQSLAYQQAWWTHLQPPGSELCTIVVRTDSGTLAGIACFYLDGQTFQFNGGKEETDYLDLIATSVDAEAVWEMVLRCLMDDGNIPWQTIELWDIPAASPSREILPQLAGHFGLAVDEQQAEVCPVIALPSSYEAYLANLESRNRRELSRKMRKATAAEALPVIVGPDDDIEAAVDDFLGLLQNSTPEKRDWLNDGRRRLFHDVARSAQEARTLQLMFLELDGKRAAALFNFDYNGRIWVYNSGLDPMIAPGLGLGVVLTGQAIDEAISLGRQGFDFLRGDEEYKYRFGAVDQPVYRLTLSR